MGWCVSTWEGWRDGAAKMLFDDGERCWNGPARSCLVSLVCGAETAVLGVLEPNRCEYTMTCVCGFHCRTKGRCAATHRPCRLSTPLACAAPGESHDEL